MVDESESKKYQKVKDLIDKRYSQNPQQLITLFRDPLDDTFYTRSMRLLQSKEKSDNLALFLQRRIDHPNLYYVGPVDYSLKTHKQFCSTFYRIEVYIPYPEQDLSKELIERKQEQNPFSNREITFLLYDLISGMGHMQQLGFVHGTLAPEYIAMTTTGYAVMEDPLLNQFRILNLKDKQFYYLCPKSYQCALEGRPSGKDFSINKSDVFAAGLILLESALNESLQNLYKKKGFCKTALKNYMDKLQNSYPDNNLLVSTLKKMLEIDEAKRPDFI